MKAKIVLFKSILVISVLFFSIISDAKRTPYIYPEDAMADMQLNPGKTYVFRYPEVNGNPGFIGKTWHNGTYSVENGQKVANVQFVIIKDHDGNIENIQTVKFPDGSAVEVVGQGGTKGGSESGTGNGHAGEGLGFDLQGFAQLDKRINLQENLEKAEKAAQKQAVSDFGEFEKSHPNGGNISDQDLYDLLLKVLKKAKFVAEYEGNSNELQGNADPRKIIDFLLENDLLTKIPILLASPSSKDHSTYEGYYQSGRVYIKYNDKIIEKTREHLKKEWALNDKIADLDPKKLVEIDSDKPFTDGESQIPEGQSRNPKRDRPFQNQSKNAESPLISVGGDHKAKSGDVVDGSGNAKSLPAKKPEDQKALSPNEIVKRENAEKDKFDRNLKKLYDKYSRLTKDQKRSWSSKKFREIAKLLQDKHNLSKKFLQSENAEAYVEIMAVANEAIEGVIETGNFLALDDLYKSLTGLDPETNKTISNTERSLALVGLVGSLGTGGSGKLGAKAFKSQISRISKLVDKLAVATEVKVNYHAIIDSALALGAKNQQGIKVLAHAFNNVVGNQIGAVGKNIDELVRASKAFTDNPKQASQFISSMKPFKNSKFTEAGRNLTKHPKVMGYESTEAMRKTLNTEAKINSAAQSVVENIIKNGKEVTKTQGRYGKIVEYRLDNGYGARFYEESNEMIGFIEP